MFGSGPRTGTVGLSTGNPVVNPTDLHLDRIGWDGVVPVQRRVAQRLPGAPPTFRSVPRLPFPSKASEGRVKIEE